jgi:hypothetical protein
MSKDFEISQVDKQTKTGTYIDIKEKDGKYRAFLTEVVNGERQPTRMAFLDVFGQGESAFMVIKAPLREVDAGGAFLLRAREKEGKFLDSKGNVVDSEDKAAREYIYKTQREDASKIVYGQVATLNVKNTKADGTPTAQTLMTVKLFSDAEALEAERVSYKLGRLEKDSEDYAKLRAEVNELRRSQGTYQNFFITKGADALRAMGFSIREREKSSDPTPG